MTAGDIGPGQLTCVAYDDPTTGLGDVNENTCTVTLGLYYRDEPVPGTGKRFQCTARATSNGADPCSSDVKYVSGAGVVERLPETLRQEEFYLGYKVEHSGLGTASFDGANSGHLAAIFVQN
ncbi:MAG: hypothetical protein ACR2G3_05535 [Solirubrobacterales bacterium]